MADVGKGEDVIGSGFRRAARHFYVGLLASLPARAAIAIHFRIKHGLWPNLSAPRTFSEKIQYRKLYGDHGLYARLADKLLVKNYVARMIGDRYVIPTLWSGDTLPAAEERTWGVPCVVKCNHGSGGNAFVRFEDELRSGELDALTEDWMKRGFAPHLKESFYDLISRQILVEPMIGEDLVDYKFYVFNGRVEFVHVDTDRFSSHKRKFFDREWRALKFTVGYPLDSTDLKRPAHLDEMIAAAEALAKDIDFVRVDFYDLPDGPKFGEMTFTPGGGCERFQPREFDAWAGDLWDAHESVKKWAR